MTAKQTSSRSIKSILGAGFLAVGLFFFFVNLDEITSQISAMAGASAETLGILPALGLAGMRALQSYNFDHAGFLSSLLQILVSFWPLLLIITGAILLRPLSMGDSGLHGSISGNSATSVRGDR
jgi:hypothetical protein